MISVLACGQTNVVLCDTALEPAQTHFVQIPPAG